MTYEEIDKKLDMIPPFALYCAITKNLNCEIENDNRPAKHTLMSFDEFISFKPRDLVEHYRYVRDCIPDDIKRIERNIKVIHNKKFKNEFYDKSTVHSRGRKMEYYKRTKASLSEIIRRFFKYGRIQLYWYHFR